MLFPAAALAAGDPCAEPIQNPVVCENTKPGTPESQWRVSGTGDPTIQGFSTSISVNKGSTISFKIRTPASSYHIDILRLGWYGGAGARMIQAGVRPSALLPQVQPDCLSQASTGLIDCGNWSVSASWTVPSTAVSGVYIAHLIRDDTLGDSLIPFVVRDDASTADIALQTNDTSWVAYNDYGGNSLYKCTTSACPPGNPGGYKAAYASSYNKPFTTAGLEGPVFWHNEYSMVRFLEANGYDLTYVSGFDVHKRGALLQNHKIFISSGHDEYWSATQRASVKAARDAGVNLAFFSGNEMFWKTRWAPSIDSSATPDRTVVSYKDTHFDARTDPVEWTGTWRDRRFITSLDDPQQAENSLTGQFFVVNQGTTAISVPAAYGKLRLWRNTAAASLPPGETLTLASSSLGYEWDEDVDNGYRPAGIFHMSSTTAAVPQVFNDYGTEVAEGTATHHLTMYRAPSGARVFGAGTVLWSWGLDSWSSNNTPDRNMQQATVNLFADMGAQPATLLPGLVAASPSTDAAAPTSTITSPAPASTVADGARITVSGSASDAGGVVAGVEVSTDGGKTWHAATGTNSWSYTWIAHGTPTAALKTRAVDDSGNIETPGPGISVSVACPCSLWGDNVTPPIADSGDGNSIEVGVSFRSDIPGQISGIRFYKSAANTGTHVGSLWTAAGQRLAKATFISESASGWQTVSFADPVTIAPDTTYVASYFAPSGHYAASRGYMYPDPAPPRGGSVLDSPPLHALRNFGTTGNGVFTYATSSTFPSSSFKAANYWVDVVFEPGSGSPPGQPTNVSATPRETSATVSWTAPAQGPVTSYRITPYIGTAAQTPTVLSGSPPATSTTIGGLRAGTAYTFTVQAFNAAGAGPVSAHSNAVTPLPSTAVAPGAPTAVTAQPASRSAQLTWTAPDSDGGSAVMGYRVTPYIGSLAQPPVEAGSATTTTIVGLDNDVTYTFSVAAKNNAGTGPDSAPSNPAVPRSTIFDFGTPTVIDVADSPVELGVKFKSDVSGWITGIRFYKGTANTGTHVGNLWSATGTRLARVTFTDETASGWQMAEFADPVAVTAGTTYVASYHTPTGRYSSTSQAFGSGPVDNAPLHALANTTSVNGVYAYGATSTFPTSSYNATNYWVDVLFTTAAGLPPGQPTNVGATAGELSATVSWTAPASGGGTITSYTVTPHIGTTAQAAKTVSGSSTSTTIGGLDAGTSYTFTVTATNAHGSGSESAHSNAVTPLAASGSPPGAPTDVTARAATSSAQVSWSAPASDGGSPITSYTVTPYIGTTAQTPKAVTGSPPATTATITGLTNGSTYTFKVKATNDAGTGGESAATNAVIPRNTIFDFATPAIAASSDAQAIEVGVKFRSDVSGDIIGIRFYKGDTNTGTHSASLWTAAGTRLAQGTFSGESASGWQTMTFASPVPIAANEIYVASYFAPDGHYAVTSSTFDVAGVDNGPLHALANTTSANGVYAYGNTSSFPVTSSNATNYWVDVLFAAGTGSPPGQPTNVSATAGELSATLSWTAPASGGSAITSYTVTPYIGTQAQTPKTVSGSSTSTTIAGLAAGTSYTFAVKATNAYGTGSESAHSNAVTPLAASGSPPGAPTGVTARAATSSAQVSWSAPASDGGSPITSYTVTPHVGTIAQTPTTVTGSPPATTATITGLTNGTTYTFTVRAANATGSGGESTATRGVTPQNTIFDFAAPAIAATSDATPVEVGVKFSSDVSGSVTGIRFYKGDTNTGTHSASLWSAGGERLAQATFSGESASGWQTAYFATPVAISANTTYVASYFAPGGHYAATSSAFASAGVDNGPLHALANTTSANGVYAYGATSSFPTNSFNATDYGVDVTFKPGSTSTTTVPAAPTSVSATAGDGTANVSWTAPADGGSAITSYTVTPYIGSTAQTPTTITGSPPATRTTITGLTNGTTYTFRVSATNAIGTGAASAASDAVTPSAAPTVPTAPTNVTAIAGSRSATVRWSIPSSNGGSAITSYTVRTYRQTTLAKTKTVSGASTTSTSVTGLTNGVTYTFRVLATNAVGSSRESEPSNAVTPSVSSG